MKGARTFRVPSTCWSPSVESSEAPTLENFQTRPCSSRRVAATFGLVTSPPTLRSRPSSPAQIQVARNHQRRQQVEPKLRERDVSVDALVILGALCGQLLTPRRKAKPRRERVRLFETEVRDALRDPLRSRIGERKTATAPIPADPRRLPAQLHADRLRGRQADDQRDRLLANLGTELDLAQLGGSRGHRGGGDGQIGLPGIFASWAA